MAKDYSIHLHTKKDMTIHQSILREDCGTTDTKDVLEFTLRTMISDIIKEGYTEFTLSVKEF